MCGVSKRKLPVYLLLWKRCGLLRHPTNVSLIWPDAHIALWRSLLAVFSGFTCTLQTVIEHGELPRFKCVQVWYEMYPLEVVVGVYYSPSRCLVFLDEALTENMSPGNGSGSKQLIRELVSTIDVHNTVLLKSDCREIFGTPDRCNLSKLVELLVRR